MTVAALRTFNAGGILAAGPSLFLRRMFPGVKDQQSAERGQ